MSLSALSRSLPVPLPSYSAVTTQVMKIFDAISTRNALPFDELIGSLHDLFIQGCEVPLRHTHKVGVTAADSGTVLLMPAWTDAGYLGVKTVMIYPGNSSKGLPGLHSTYILYDASTGVPLALMDGNEITSRRTAAASALAASIVANAQVRCHLTVGAGRVGRLIPEAYSAAMKIETFLIWDRKVDNARRVVDELRKSGIDARVSDDLAADVGMADIITCATLATKPIVKGKWLKPGAHLDLIGSFTPEMREVDDDCFVDADIYVDTDEALKKSGELLGPMSRRIFYAEDVRATLSELCRTPPMLRRKRNRRTVFKSVGTALEDLAAATLVYNRST